jgi:hypothetical protein
VRRIALALPAIGPWVEDGVAEMGTVAVAAASQGDPWGEVGQGDTAHGASSEQACDPSEGLAPRS